MTDSPDPAAAVRAMLDQWLALSSAVAERSLGPSRADVMAIAAAVAALDVRLARIEAALAALARPM